MTTDPRSILGSLLVLLVLASLSLPLTAQEAEGDDDETGFGEVFAELGVWIAQPAGLEYHAATLADPGDPFNTRVLNPTHGTESAMRYRGGYEFSRNVGAIVFTWYAQEEMTTMSEFRPGEFVFGEILAHPLYAGYANDGLADGFRQNTGTLLRDLRGDFYRTAFRSGRVEAKWFVGYRRIHFQRRHDVDYFGLVPDFPALVQPVTDPRPDLDPRPDEVFSESWYIGRGFEGGMDFLAPFWRDRFSLEGGFAVAVLRGKADTQYRSTTHFYELDTGGGTSLILGPPYDEFDEVISSMPTIDSISQEDVAIGLNTISRSLTGTVVETYLGMRAKVTKNLEIFGGWRNAQYDGVGIDLRPTNVVATSVGLNVQDVTESERSATYEGFYGGVAVRF